MTALGPLDTLFDASQGSDIPLPASLARLYGDLRFSDDTRVIANFVQTLDGVTALTDSGKAGGGPISGYNEHDMLVMGLLRACSDAIIVGAGTARLAPNHVWRPEAIYPALAGEFRDLRASLTKPEAPLTVFVTASGDIDPGHRAFAPGSAPALITTTNPGARLLAQRGTPSHIKVLPLAETEPLSATAILAATSESAPGGRALLEGGPRLMASFLDEGLIDELFLTLSPQVAGRDGGERPGLVEGKTFAPDDPRRTTLLSVKRSGDFLFLRYAFDRK